MNKTEEAKKPNEEDVVATENLSENVSTLVEPPSIVQTNKEVAFLGTPIPSKSGFPRPDGTYKEDNIKEPDLAGVVNEEKIEPIIEHDKYELGTLIPITEPMERIEALENRVNRLIEALDKSRSVRHI